MYIVHTTYKIYARMLTILRSKIVRLLKLPPPIDMMAELNSEH